MSHSSIHNSDAEEEVREAIERWTAALYEKDIEAMHRDYDEKYTLFDVKATVRSVEGAKELWAECMPYFDKPKVEYRDLEIRATSEMAVAHFKSRILGMATPPPPEMANSWLRGTVCFQKIDGKWKCIHEHISFPVDCEKNEIVYSEE